MAVASRSQRSSNTVIKFTRLSLCPDVINSFVLAARVLTCRWVIRIAVLSPAKNGDHFSSSFFHLKYSCFESLANSAAMLAGFCVAPAPAGKVEKMRAYLRLLSQICCSRGWDLHPLPPEFLPKCLVAVSLSPRRSPSHTRRELSIGTCVPC